VQYDFSNAVYPSVIIPVSDTATNYVQFFLKGSEIPLLLFRKPDSNGIRYSPAFPLEQGNSYEIVTRPNGGEKSVKSYVPALPLSPSPVKMVSYPITDQIPANVLQFHLTFSKAMMQDLAAYEKISLVNQEGEEVERPWRHKSDWSFDGKHLAIMIHPANVKRGIGHTNSVFEIGKTYQIRLDRKLVALDGSVANPQVVKEFVVVENDYNVPQLLSASIEAEVNGVDLVFDDAMDYGTLRNGVVVKDAKGRPIPTQLQVKSDYTYRLLFSADHKTPATLEIDPVVSDLAFNSLTRTFEVSNSEEIASEFVLRLPVQPDEK